MKWCLLGQQFWEPMKPFNFYSVSVFIISAISKCNCMRTHTHTHTHIHRVNLFFSLKHHTKTVLVLQTLSNSFHFNEHNFKYSLIFTQLKMYAIVWLENKTTYIFFLHLGITKQLKYFSSFPLWSNHVYLVKFAA